MLVCNISHLENQQFEYFKPCPIPLTVVTLSNLEALLKVLYCWETIPLTITLFTFRQLGLLMLPQKSANNGNDVGHTNGDLHAANVDNNQGSDNNGDHASII